MYEKVGRIIIYLEEQKVVNIQSSGKIVGYSLTEEFKKDFKQIYIPRLNKEDKSILDKQLIKEVIKTVYKKYNIDPHTVETEEDYYLCTSVIFLLCCKLIKKWTSAKIVLDNTQ